MAQILIRKMMEIDLESVVMIEKESFSDPWSYDSFWSDLANEISMPIVALQDDIVIGYSILYIVADELQIGNFAVATQFRRQGVGNKLMDEIIKIAVQRGCNSIYLEVRESNKPAQALYLSFGFKDVGRRNGYYRSPRENAILMAKEL
ncbi:MAG TPA: ribosomal-protein-alanine N-acetyltransferase [candidate division Zixibacteria bacterium]|nr:ribosomal-protein-alanine N-acetyltransferase [candidate division Zixibacteria bacterium]